MSVGIVMLVHANLNRAAQLVRHWRAANCPVVLHVDRNVPSDVYTDFKNQFAEDEDVLFSKRFRCEWGTWGIVAASQAASELMLSHFKQVAHVYLASGACLPLRPVQELITYLEERPQTDFIESYTIADSPWAVGGLDEERFTLRFPFSWKRQRKLFDKYVDLQRKVGVKRSIPDNLQPHMGSQWWCLSRKTLTSILEDPKRKIFDNYFRRVWIPDESYYQTLVRKFSTNIESRSLTLSKFDYQGKPHIFYDDHLQLLRRSDCFVARKIWPHANRLYHTFLNDPAATLERAEPNPGKIDRIFSKAVERRTKGRAGLYMQSRLPRHGMENGITAGEYSVFQGLSYLFEDFEHWLESATGTRVHGHLYAMDKVEYSNGQVLIEGAMCDSVEKRDYDAEAFLSSLIWNTRGDRQCFQYGPLDTQDITGMLARDPNAHITLVSGAWAVKIFRSNQDFAQMRRQAAYLQQVESRFIEQLRSNAAKARAHIITMAEFVESPMIHLQKIIDDIGQHSPRRLGEVPKMHELHGFGQFLQNLKNQGMHPHLMGDFPVTQNTLSAPQAQRKPYLVR